MPCKPGVAGSIQKGGGVAIFVKSGIDHKILTLPKSNLEAAGMRIFGLRKTIDIINIYAPPHTPITQNELQKITDNLNENKIILGDFNSHNRLWEFHCNRNDDNSLEIINFLADNDLTILNDGTDTRHDIHTDKFTAIDLTFTNPTLGIRSNWTVHNDLIGSDHFPIITEIEFKYQFNQYTHTPKWKLDKADWDHFRTILRHKGISIENEEDINKCNETLIEAILGASNDSIPKTKQKNKKAKSVPWWNEQCAVAVFNKRKAYRKYRRYRTEYHYLRFKQLRSETRDLLDQTKKDKWIEFISILNHKTDSKTIWNMIKKINGKPFSPTNTLVVNNIRYTDSKQKAEILTNEYVKISSNQSYSREFVDLKTEHEPQIDLVFEQMTKLDNDKAYNANFSMKELKTALNSKKNTAPGADTIHYEMIKQLPEKEKFTVLKLMNKSWDEGKLPDQWKEATIIPFLKPNKDSNDPQSYRPISLTSAICKTMETMVNNRAKKILDKQISDTQSGFRNNRSTIDQLTKLESAIKAGQLNDKKVVAVFLDLKKAFDLMWRKGVILKLTEFGIKGKMLKWINDFLVDRKIRVKVEDQVSDYQKTDNGSPQGVVLSPTLFNVIMDTLRTAMNHLMIKKGIDLSQFADDSAFWKSAKGLKKALYIIQLALNVIEDWGKNWGFEISPDKTQVVIFNPKGTDTSKLRKLKLNGRILEYKREATFLGMIFDDKLTWRKHIDNLVTKCQKDLNVLRAVSGTSFGADKKTLRNLYVALILSKIEYGLQAYASASNTQIARLDAIQNAAMRIMTGAYKATSTKSLEVECNLPPIRLKCEEIALKYWARSSALRDKLPINRLTEQKAIYVTRRHKIKGKPPYVIRIQDLLQEHDMTDIKTQPPKNTDLANIRSINLRSELAKTIDKKTTSIGKSEKMTNKYIDRRYKGTTQIYTDRSKDPENNRVRCAFVIPEFNATYKFKLNDHLTVYSAELVAILMALRWANKNKLDNIVILTDSLSSVQSLNSGKSKTRQDILDQILREISLILDKKVTLNIDWCPSHCNVAGNEMADKAAKQAMDNGNVVKLLPTAKEVYPIIHSKIREKWQKEWVSHVNHRNIIDPNLTTKITQYSDNRKLDIVYTRLRLGANGLKANNMFHGMADPTCDYCQNELEDTDHYLLYCPQHHDEREILKKDIKQICNHYFSTSLLLNPPKKLATEIREAVFKYITNTGYISII